MSTYELIAIQLNSLGQLIELVHILTISGIKKTPKQAAVLQYIP